MQTRAGSYYQVELQLSGAESVGPTWLVAAVTGTYPGADVAEVARYDGHAATVIVRWRTGYGEINAGDRVVASAEGVEVPAGALPSAEVTAVSEVEQLVHPEDVVAGAVERLPVAGSIALKLTLAATLIGAVVYLSRRIPTEEATWVSPS